MKELGLDPTALGLRKYDPDQPRVPAGNGRESGRWGDGTSGDDGTSARPNPSASIDTNVPRLPIVPIAADGPLKPGGLDVVPMPGLDPLDPKDLNTPLSPTEHQAIAATIEMC